ncbi:MAG: hypothetical protein NTU81_02440 [Candidatus Nomurabacteria bacterium]|nr:hypothetical protein [Candidatus Nomurabacteria bacterium]
MTKFLITPIYFHYIFLGKLVQDAAILSSINFSDSDKYQQFKISIFLNFNRYLMNHILSLEDIESDRLMELLIPAMEKASEEDTLMVLKSHMGSFDKIRSEFLEIFNNHNK